MKLLTIGLLLVTVVATVEAVCTNPRIRMEWNQLSAAQKALFVQAAQALAARPASGQFSDPTRMAWHDFVQTHSKEAFWTHGNAQFYPYHRAMMWQFELAIISTGIWPSDMGVPYFDWPAMSQNWWTSDIFSDRHFGAINSRDPNHCVLTGAFSKDKFRVAPDPDRHRVVTGDQTCLRRNAQQTALVDASVIARSLSPTTYSDFTGHNLDESNFHASGHGWLGGEGADMSNPSVSPNDPIFFLHHGLVDKYWWRWQSQCEAYKFSYQGRLARADDPVGDGTINAGKHLYVNSWPFTVAQLLDTQGDTLCYTYSQSAGDLPPPPTTCPEFDASQQNATVPPPPPPGSAADEAWLTKGLISLIKKTSITFKNEGSIDSISPPAQDSESEIVFGRDFDSGFVHSASTSAASTTSTDSTILASESGESTQPSTSATSTQSLSGSTTETTSHSSSIQNTTTTTETTSSSPSIQAQNTTVPEPPKTFNETITETNSTIVSYSFQNVTIEVAAGYKIVEVYPNSVVTTDSEGNLKHFFAMAEKVEYKPNPDAPQNVEPGSNPCYLAYPKPLPCEYIKAMGMCCDAFESSYNRVRMRIDEFNANNCTTLFSPSSMMNQKF
ncbi:hypothetical protein BDR26DRAFT_850243 [Obelidium mucronatum]|nr:hypothetical protein BDR26DRAFT_850243 [Obelidium mucronatum]